MKSAATCRRGANSPATVLFCFLAVLFIATAGPLPAAPQITTQPASQSLVAGQDATFTVEASGLLPLTFQWHNGAVDLEGETNATLVLTQVQETQAGPYSVTVTDGSGSTDSDVAMLTVMVPPAIVTQPVAQNAFAGADVEFNVSATGTDLTYQWKFNGSVLSGATAATLTLPNVQQAQAGTYKVDVENAAGMITSSEVVLTVYEVPHITVQPLDRVLNQGQTTDLSVNADGIPAPAFQWWFNDQPLAAETGSTLTLSPAQGNQSGNYWVVVSNLAGAVTSRVASVQVIVTPSIAQQPVAKSVLPGASVQFNVVATGSPSTYQWKFNGAILSGATGDTLTLSDVQAGQAGTYQVEIENAAGTVVSSEVTLTVYQVPLITLQPVDRILNQGQSTTLTVTAEGSDPLSYVWFHEAGPLPGATTGTLSLTSVQGNQSGSYYVVVSNVAGTVTSRVAQVHVVVPPVIVQQPLAQEVFPETSATFAVVATGTDLLYQWKFNGSALGGATNDTLTLTNVQLNHAGSYKVDIENAAGAVTSAEVLLTVYQAASITTQPLDQVLLQGQSTNLTVLASGIPAPAYQWWFNDQPIFAATNAALPFVSAQGNQSGSYSVVVSNLAGTVTSRVATVQVIVPPTITQQPAAQSVLPGSTVTFSVVASGTSLACQWKFNGLPISGATNGALTLPNVQAAHAGLYKVDLANAAGSVTSTEVTLTVYQAPVITVQPLDRTLNQGQNTTLSVTANGIPSPAYRWWFNNQPLPTATNPTLNLSSIQSSQAGPYWVVISNVAGVVTSRIATVQVIVPPAIVQQPAAQSVLPGATVTFSVVATGTAPIYQWKFNGAAISGATNAALTLPNVQSAQAGSYKVDVQNAAATVTSTTVSLTVYQAPLLTVQPLDRVLNQGQSTNLTVAANGIPNPAYQWWFSNAPLPGATSATLNLSSVQGSQSGSYWAVVSNLAGVVTSRVASVLVIVPPAIVQQPSNKSVLPGSSVTWSVTATGTALTYQWKFNGVAITGATNQTLVMANVQSAQAGAYKVDVRNAAGAVTSAEVTLTVYQAPVITVQPLDRILNQGQSTNLTVAANGIPNPAYQWWFTNAPLSGATNAILPLASAQGAQSGSYFAVVSNVAGVVTSRVASVLVIVPPAIVQQPVAQSVLPGTTVSFNVVATGTAPTYQWKKNGAAITGATNAVLTLPLVLPTDAAAYRVDVSNAAGTVTSVEVTLTIFQAPTITGQPSDRILNQGQSSSLNVTALGVPFPSYRWWFNNAPLLAGTNATLPLTSVQPNQAGSYFVAVSNVAGVVTSRVASVQVIVPPAIVQQPVSQTVDRGDDVIFNVVASGTSPRYQWSFNSIPLPNATNASLQLLDVIPPQAGSYSVAISNAAGKVTSTVATLAVRRIDVYWVLAGSGAWDKPANWSRGEVPTSWDNVFIVSNGTYTVTVSSNAAVGSLTLGGASGGQTLAVNSGIFDLSTNGLAPSLVTSNGVFELNGGTLIGRSLALSGRLSWSKGEVRNLVRVLPEGRLDLVGNIVKGLTSGVLDNSGVTVWSGSGNLQLDGGASITNSGIFEIQNNAALVSTNQPGPSFVNAGTLRKTTMANLTGWNGVNLLNRGTIDLQTGGIDLLSGKHLLSDGSRVTGSNALYLDGAELTLAGAVSSQAPLEFNSGAIKGAWSLLGSMNWRGGTMNSGGTVIGTLNLMGGIAANALTVNGPVNLSAGDISGGPFTANGDLNWTGGRISSTQLALNGNVTWVNGVLSGRMLVPQNRSFVMTGTGTRQIDGGVLSNRTTLVLSSPVSISCDNGATIYNHGTIQLNHDTPWAGGTGVPSRFFNFGQLVKAGTGQLNWTSVEFHNFSTANLAAGTLALGAKAHSLEGNSSVSGTGRLLLTSGTLALGTNVTCAPTLEIAGGAVTASGPFLGNVDWSGGSLAGLLTLGATRQFHLLGTGTKTFLNGLVLNLAGSSIVEGTGPLLFYAGATINNTGDFEIRSGGNFTFNASDRASFNNNGALRKTVATAVLPFGALQLVNRGSIDVQTGSISFTSLLHSLENGSSLTGPGTVQINGATVNLNGTVTCATPLALAAGTLGGTGTLQGGLNWSGGTVAGTLTVSGDSSWSTGSLTGRLNLLNSGTLTVSSVTTKTISGVLTNQGRVVVLDKAVLTLASLAPLVNKGIFEIQYDKPFTATALQPVFQNSGTFLKTGPKIVTDFGTVLLQNSGTIDLPSGDLTFSQNNHTFYNGTRTTGSGSLRVTGATLTANGTATLGAPFVLASGVLAGNATLNGDVTFSGGTVPGTFLINGDAAWGGGEINGAVTANGAMSWSAGLLSGTLIIPTNASAYVLTANSNSISGTLQNAGTVVLSNTSALKLLSGTPIVNSGLFEVQNEAPFKSNGITRVNFVNSGTLRKTTSNKPMDFTFVLLQNSGTLDLRAGEMFFRANTHTFNNGSRTLGTGAVHLAGATVTAAGTMTLGAPLYLENGVLAGSATFNGPFVFSGGQLTASLAVNGSANWTGGILKGSLNVNGAGSWAAGQLEGNLTVATNSDFSISGSSLKYLKGGSLNNLGRITLLPLARVVGDDTAVVQNYGGFIVPGSATFASTNGRPLFNNYGALSLTNDFGSFTFQGDFRQFPGGVCEVEVGGRDAGTNFNRLLGVNTATLAGGLNVRLVDGFAPARGDRFEILKFASRSGAFATYTANTPAISPAYSATNVTLFAEGPSITSQPQSLTLNDGSTATFSVGVTGTTPLAYRWFRDGVFLNATNTALTQTNVQPVHEGLYTFVATNVWGAVTSAPAALIVIVQPGITRQPDSITMVEGQDASFAVETSGTHLTYQWKLDKDPIPGATNSTLLFAHVTAAQAGDYKVEVRNAAGVVTSRIVTLTVLVPPTITQQPTSADVISGNGVTLYVRANGTTPFSYQWLKDGNAITGANQSSYSINHMSSAQEGSYVVIVANAAAYVYSSNAVLRVSRAPQITMQPLSQTVPRGSNALLTVAVTGIPTPILQWRLNGVTLPGANQPTLLLTNVQPKDSGRYSVVAANLLGTVQSVDAELKVVAPAVPFADKFADRGILYTASGSGRGTNCGATQEAGEPRLGKSSSHNFDAPSSVWVSWWAPANGIVTFTTLGSGFDTVLGVFRGSTVSGLSQVALDDDSAGFHCSKVSFNAQAGTYYEIAVAGVGGACGEVVLNWNLIQTTELLPEIVEAPLDQTANTHDKVTLKIVYNVFEPTAIQWFYQGQILTNATLPTLTLQNLQENNVGGYSVRLTGASGRSVVSAPGDIQINTEGATAVSARNKFFDGFERALK